MATRDSSGLSCLGILGIIFAIGLLIQFWYIILPIGVLYGIYLYHPHKKKVQQKIEEKQRTQQLINEWDEELSKFQLQLRLLEHYLQEGQTDLYCGTAQNVLDKIPYIQSLSLQVDRDLDENFQKLAQEAKQKILFQLELIKESANSTPSTSENILEQAPELTSVYTNIQKDNQAIIERIQLADNPEELQAIHEANMERFETILNGYLRIKSSPKDYYHAEERLVQAKQALEKFDLDLDETLRKLNESDLRDFAVSLRIMTETHTDLADHFEQKGKPSL